MRAALICLFLALFSAPAFSQGSLSEEISAQANYLFYTFSASNRDAQVITPLA